MSKRDDRREELEKIRRDAQNDAAREEHDPPPAPGFFAQIFSSEKDIKERYEDIETYENAHESEVERREEITAEFVEALAEAIREKREAASYSEFIPIPSNTNIGATTERYTFWGNIIGYSMLIGVIILGLILLMIQLIGKMGNFSDPLQRPEPEPTSFSVTIDSSPSGATVFIDKKQVGITPYSTTLEKGSHGIRIEKEGYESAYRITEGKNQEFNFKLKEE